MCRHIAWLGADRTLADLIVNRPFGLMRQAWAPRQQRHGRLNADGFGVGWYVPAARVEPARYRRAQPMWTDASFASFAGVVASGCVLAAVRNATVGMPIEESATAPYTHAGLLLSHNGRVDVDILSSLLAGRPDAPAPDSRCDSALLAALVWERVLAGVDLPEAVAEVVVTVGTKARARRAGSDADAGFPPERLNLLVTDGQRIVATTWNETLWYRAGAAGVLVVSEPDDDAPAVPAPRSAADGDLAPMELPGHTGGAPGGGDLAGPGAETAYGAAVPESGSEPHLCDITALAGESSGADVWVEVQNHRLLVADTREVTLSNLIS